MNPADPAAGGEWTREFFTYFWDQRTPYAVQHDIEKRTGTLLHRDTSQTHPLVYTGVLGSYLLGGRIELRFESSMLNGTLYSLRFDAVRRRDFSDESRFHADSERAFQHWLRHIHVTQDPGEVEWASGERYDRLVRMTLEFEAKRAAIKEDPAAIAAAQQAVLAALRAGKCYAVGHHEGVTRVQMEGDLLVKRETGEENSAEFYSGEEEMLRFLRGYFDYDARKDTHPHKPPETEIWKYIGYQLK